MARTVSRNDTSPTSFPSTASSSGVSAAPPRRLLATLPDRDAATLGELLMRLFRPTSAGAET